MQEEQSTLGLQTSNNQRMAVIVQFYLQHRSISKEKRTGCAAAAPCTAGLSRTLAVDAMFLEAHGVDSLEKWANQDETQHSEIGHRTYSVHLQPPTGHPLLLARVSGPPSLRNLVSSKPPSSPNARPSRRGRGLATAM
jgi:hypothetical protein